MRIRGLVIITYLLFISLKGISQISCNLSLLATPVNASCDNACNGSVVLTPSGGTAPYSFNAFDHSFPGPTVDLSLFDIRNGNFSIATPGQLTAQANPSVNTMLDNSIATKDAFPDNGKLVVESSFFIDYNAYAYYGLALNGIVSTRTNLPYSFFFSFGTLYISHEGSLTVVTNYSSSTWYDFMIEKLGNTVNYYLRNTGVSTYTLIATKTATLSNSHYKLASLYRNTFSSYGGFNTTNWRVGGNPPTTGLCPGTYTYTVFDAMGCFANASVTIGGGGGANSLQLNGTVTAASCGAASDGAIDLTPTGGTGPYSYGFAHVFQGGSINTNIFELRNGNFSQGTDLRQGTNYNNNNSWDNSIAIKQSFSDGGYLVMDASFKFDPNAEVIFGFTSTGVINDYSKVMVGFRVVNGTLLYAYNQTAGLQQVGTITADTWYDFRIEKTGSIVKFYSRPYNTGSYNLLFTTTYSTTNIEFKAAALNFANFYSSSGGYNTKGWNIQSTPKVAQLSPGTYTYTITDANGCSATSVFNIGANSNNGVSLNAGLINGTIANASTGAVSLTPAGGTAPYSYTLNPDFSGAVINPAILKVTNGAFSQSSGSIRANSTSNAIWDNSISTNLSFTDAGKLSLIGSFSFDANPNTYFGFTDNSNLNGPAQVQLGFHISGTQLFARSGSTNYLIGSLISANTWYDLKVEKTGSLVRFYMRNAGSGSFNLIYTLPYSGTTTEFKAGVLMFGTSGGFNTNGWSVDCNPPTTGLASGIYIYRVYDAKGCFGLASVNVPVSSTITFNTQGNNSSAWNVCDGTTTVTSAPANNFEVVSKLFQDGFVGTQFNSGRFNKINGAFTQNDALVSGTNYNSTGWNNSVVTNDAFPDNGTVIAEMEMNFKTGAEVYFGFASATQTITSYLLMPYAFSYQSGKLLVYSAETGNTVIGNITAGQWHGFRIEKRGSVVLFYLRYSSNTQYNLVHTLSTSQTGSNYKVGVVNFFSTQTGPDRGYSSKNWKAFNQATTTGLCQGNYNYAIVNNGNTLAETSATVGTLLSIVETMTGPADVVVNTDATKAFATGVSIGSPTFSGPITGIIIENDAPAQFPIGITNILWIATDGVKTVTGTQKVTVVDNEDPTISAPANVTVTLFAAQTIATNVSLGIPMVNDNVPGVTFSNDAPGQFPIGITTVTWTAADAAGNTATATQVVTVVKVLLPQISAPANVSVNTDTNQSFATNVNLGTLSIAGSSAGLTINNNAPAQFPIGTNTVTWTVSDLFGNTFNVDQLVIVTDNQPPSITAPNDILVDADAGVNYATGVNLGTAVTGDNSGTASISNDNTLTQYPIGVTIITWTATDASGNTTTDIQKVTVADNQPPTIAAPANVTINTDMDQDYASNVNLGIPVVSDNAGGVTYSKVAPSQFPLGTTTIVWTATDAAGNTSTATQTVTVTDIQPPTIAAPANVTTNTDMDQDYASNVNLGTPVVTDNAAGVTYSKVAPSQFPLGTTTIVWTATDAAGNTSTATQTVTVTDNQAPTITAPANVTTNTDMDQDYASNVNLGTPVVSDNAGGVTYSKVAPSQFPLGTTTIVWTATDAAGNTSTATQTVTVTDNQPPTIAAPANVTTNTDMDQDYASNVNLGTPVVTDNAAGVTYSKVAPSQFPLGTTTIVWTATDAAGNTSTATQTVTVVDNQAPTITAPANVSISINATQTTASGVNLGSPTYSDNASGATVINDAPAVFPIGATTITWTVTDAAGNSATATQTVTVNVVSQPPVAICKPVQLTLVNGEATLTTSQVNNGSTAAAGIATMLLSKTTFGCSDIGLNTVVFTVIDNNGLSSTCTTTVNIIGSVTSVSISSVPTNNTYTGGVATNLFIGYGSPSTKLQVNVPSTGAPYTYSWTGTDLSSTTASNPVFTPTSAGNYVFVVTVKNKYGCISTESITICVKDIRVEGKNGKKDNKKVYICHRPPGNPANANVLEVSINAVAAHLQHGDMLGTCNQPCGTEANRPMVKVTESFDVRVSPNPTSNYFVVQVQSADKTNKVAIRVMDAFGRTILRESLSAGTTLKFGDGFANGSYYLEAVQGTEKKVIKLLKM